MWPTVKYLLNYYFRLSLLIYRRKGVDEISNVHFVKVKIKLIQKKRKNPEGQVLD